MRQTLIGGWFLLTLSVSFVVHAQPHLQRLHPDDPLYRQHQELLAEYHHARKRDEPLPPLIIFSYRPRNGDTLFSVAARLTIPYSAVASLNRLARPDLPDDTILIPTQPGLFLHNQTRSRLEEMIADRLKGDADGPMLHLTDTDGPARAEEPVLFVPGADYTPAERALFLRGIFVDPLPMGVVSSRYGYRVHPVTGLRIFHRGIDLAAPFGSPVVSAAAGVVAAIRRDPLLGLSVHIDHRNGYRTVYAHLQEAMVRVNETVTAGQQIGAVGSTGYSTGPHLHFEIIRDGRNQDPEQYIR